MKRVLVALGATALLAGCTTISTPSDMTALHYNGGMIEGKTFDACVNASTREWHDGGDVYYMYPASQRYYEFDSGKETDSKSITFVTKDGIEMAVTGIVNFDLNNDCATLQVFHERIGNRLNMYFNDSGESEGWSNGLDKFLGNAINTAVDRAGQQYKYTELYNDATVKAQWEKDVLTLLPDLVNRQTDGEETFFSNFAITLQKPEPPQTIKDALTEQQAAVARANAAKAEADAKVLTANAQIELEKAEAAKVKEWLAVLGEDGYLKKYAIDKNLNPYPIAGDAIVTK